MAVVVPIGFLVNTDDIGNHYGQYNTTSGELLAYVRQSKMKKISVTITCAIFQKLNNYMIMSSHDTGAG